jgi:hypothetical protein
MSYGFKETHEEYCASNRINRDRLNHLTAQAKPAVAKAITSFNQLEKENRFRIMGEPRFIISPEEPIVIIKIDRLEYRASGHEVEEEDLDTTDDPAIAALTQFISRHLQVQLDLTPSYVQIHINPSLYPK